MLCIGAVLLLAMLVGKAAAATAEACSEQETLWASVSSRKGPLLERPQFDRFSDVDMLLRLSEKMEERRNARGKHECSEQETLWASVSSRKGPLLERPQFDHYSDVDMLLRLSEKMEERRTARGKHECSEQETLWASVSSRKGPLLERPQFDRFSDVDMLLRLSEKMEERRTARGKHEEVDDEDSAIEAFGVDAELGDGTAGTLIDDMPGDDGGPSEVVATDVEHAQTNTVAEGHQASGEQDGVGRSTSTSGAESGKRTISEGDRGDGEDDKDDDDSTGDDEDEEADGVDRGDEEKAEAHPDMPPGRQVVPDREKTPVEEDASPVAVPIRQLVMFFATANTVIVGFLLWYQYTSKRTHDRELLAAQDAEMKSRERASLAEHENRARLRDLNAISAAAAARARHIERLGGELSASEASKAAAAEATAEHIRQLGRTNDARLGQQRAAFTALERSASDRDREYTEGKAKYRLVIGTLSSRLGQARAAAKAHLRSVEQHRQAAAAAAAVSKERRESDIRARSAAAAAAGEAAAALKAAVAEAVAEAAAAEAEAAAGATMGAAAAAPAAAAAVGVMASQTNPDQEQQQAMFSLPSPTQPAGPPSHTTSGTALATVGQEEKQIVRLLDGEEEPLQSKKPIIRGVAPWSNGALKIAVDDDGNCYASSWMLAALLWAVQNKRELSAFEDKLLEHDGAGGAFARIPAPYRSYVKEFLAFVAKHKEDYQRQSGGGGRRAAIKRVARVMRGLMGGAARGARDDAARDDAHGVEVEPLHARLKWGMGLMGRALDVHWACRNSFPGDLDELRTIGKSVEYAVAVEHVLQESRVDGGGDISTTDVMRPGCGLGYVVGMEAEYVLPSGESNIQDFTEKLKAAAKNGTDPNQPVVGGIRVVKLACNHYEVRVDEGPLATHLARTFGVDLSKGDDEARESMVRGAEWQRNNAMAPNWETMLSAKELEDAFEAARQHEAGREEAAVAKEPGSSNATAAAAAAAPSSATSASPTKGRAQHEHTLDRDEACARAVQKADEDAHAAEREQRERDDAASEDLVRALAAEEEKTQSSGKPQGGGASSNDDEGEWKTAASRRRRNGSAKQQVAAAHGGGRAKR